MKQFLVCYDSKDAFTYAVRNKRVYKLKPILADVSELIRKLFRQALSEDGAMVNYSVYLVGENAVTTFKETQKNLRNTLTAIYQSRIEEAKKKHDNKALARNRKRLFLVQSDWQHCEPAVKIFQVTSQ